MKPAAAPQPGSAKCRFCGAFFAIKSRAIGDHLEIHIEAGKLNRKDKFKEKLEMAGAEIKTQYLALFKTPAPKAPAAPRDPIKQIQQPERKAINHKTFDVPVLRGMTWKEALEFVAPHNRILMDVAEDKQRDKRGIRDLVLNRIVVKVEKGKIIEIVRLG